MKRIIVLIASLFIASNAFADACGKALTGMFTAGQAVKACATLVAKNQASTITTGTLTVPTLSITTGGAGITGGITLLTGGLTLTTNTIVVSAGSSGTMGIELRSSGTTVGIQEATAASACMGVATPQGNTPVAVTTSCAVTGYRVIYSRIGAISNMGTITTTTAPNGSGFSFASTGASDTTSGSVIYLIIGEAA